MSHHKFTPKIGDEFVKNGRRIFIRHERDGGYDVAIYHADIDNTKDSDGDGVPDGAIGLAHISREKLLRDLEGAARVQKTKTGKCQRCGAKGLVSYQCGECYIHDSDGAPCGGDIVAINDVPQEGAEQV